VGRQQVFDGREVFFDVSSARDYFVVRSEGLKRAIRRAAAWVESQTPESRAKVGLGLVFFSSLLFAGSNLFVKQATEEVSPFVVAFWRGAVGLVMVLLLSRFKVGKLLGANRLLLLLRGVGGTLALILFFSSITHTSLSNAVGLFNTYPLFTTIIGVLFFKEPWRRVYILALLCSLGGVLLIVRPELGFVGTGEILGLTSVFFVGWVINLVRYLRKTDSVYAIIFYFTLTTSIVTFFPAWEAGITGSVSLWPQLFAVGFLTTLAQLFMTAGYTYCTAAGGSIVSLLGLPLTFLLSNSVLGEKLGFFLLAGGGLIFLSGYLIAFSKRTTSSPKRNGPGKGSG
jgi:drug/metabolite transporter (DMT)-like permease